MARATPSSPFTIHMATNQPTTIPPIGAQLAIDAASEVVCAGTQDSFEIFVWSVQTGRLLEILSGHEGPVTSLAFNPVSAVLCSGSWDHEVRNPGFLAFTCPPRSRPLLAWSGRQAALSY